MPIASLQMLKARFTPPEYGNFGSGNKCYFNYDLVTDELPAAYAAGLL